jgi:hypothetical protein
MLLDWHKGLASVGLALTESTKPGAAVLRDCAQRLELIAKQMRETAVQEAKMR